MSEALEDTGDTGVENLLSGQRLREIIVLFADHPTQRFSVGQIQLSTGCKSTHTVLAVGKL